MFEEREKELQGVQKGSTEWGTTTRKWRNNITNSCRDDYRMHVARIIKKMEEAADKGDYRGVHEGVKRLIGSANKSTG
jgi:hypothetical protein